MQTPAARVLPLALCLLAAGCASRSLPKYEKPLARTQFQTVRTTAYTDTEGDHLKYTNHNACGDCLQNGPLNSAACDWSRWPVGTIFRVKETGENFIIDDYGWALSGTNTIDLYKSSREAMNAWGVQRIHLEIEQWGDARRSLAILRERTKYAHVRRMVDEIKSRYAELTKPMPLVPLAPDPTAIATTTPTAAATADSTPLIDPPLPSSPRAEPIVTRVASTQQTSGGFVPPTQSRPPLTPFTNTSNTSSR